MKGVGPRFERETVIVLNEEDGSASVWTASAIMDRKLRRLGLELIHEGERHGQFKVPKGQISIRRKSRVSASAKAKAAERMKSLHQKGGSSSGSPQKYTAQPLNGLGSRSL